MIDATWNIDEEGRDAEFTGTPRPLLSTWHYLHAALRREWRTWAALALLGAELGSAAVLLMPPVTTGTVTVLMAHPASVDAASAMATDVTLFNTREVAERTVRELGLTISPDAFQTTTKAVPVTPEILTITVPGPDDTGAKARASALTEQYLSFRATQLRSLTSGLIAGYRTRIAAQQEQVNVLNREYSQANDQGPAAQDRAAELLTKRTQLNSQITTMQQAIEDASLDTDAAISSTHVIDPARAVRPSVKKAIALDMGSGLIAGAAVGVGFVLFRALTSSRLRSRQDVAVALGAPVRFSVRSKGPSERDYRRLRRQRRHSRIRIPRRRRRRGGPWRQDDLTTLVHGVESVVLPGTVGAPSGKSPLGRPDLPQGVAVAAVGNPQVAAVMIDAVATHLRTLGRSVFLADLSASGALADLVSPVSLHEQGSSAEFGVVSGPRVFRPTGVPGLARGPRRAAPGAVVDLPMGHPLRAEWDAADVVLALVEVDPGIDVDNLRTWVDQVVPLVTAGRSTAELLETTADLIRGAGLGLPFAMMVGSDGTDQSVGLISLPHAGPPAVSAGAP